MALLSSMAHLAHANDDHDAPFSRRAAIGDFDEFNEIFENASIMIPETYDVSQRVGLINLDMTIENIKCYDISVGDIAISNERVNQKRH